LSSSDAAPVAPLDRSLRPTSGVLLLLLALLGDLLLLVPRVVASLCCARRWRARTERLLFTRSPAPDVADATQDPHPAR
jgi:hypothetical protein